MLSELRESRAETSKMDETPPEVQNTTVRCRICLIDFVTAKGGQGVCPICKTKTKVENEYVN